MNQRMALGGIYELLTVDSTQSFNIVFAMNCMECLNEIDDIIGIKLLFLLEVSLQRGQ
jgi:hypothetical protein